VLPPLFSFTSKVCKFAGKGARKRREKNIDQEKPSFFREKREKLRSFLGKKGRNEKGGENPGKGSNRRFPARIWKKAKQHENVRERQKATVSKEAHLFLGKRTRRPTNSIWSPLEHWEREATTRAVESRDYRQQPQGVLHQVGKLVGARETHEIVERTEEICYNRGAL